ncbi:hypothetical protein B9479_001268 [Cryptococcus floricola]|uniref:Ribosomal protein S11 n=1 Tax=Cryptococcus floricola TaxID=2591691 RepID=A0A5D3B6X0_9TREE|nr:hypothetical protein B9479_001268 [Cryptococcus floricola]
MASIIRSTFSAPRASLSFAKARSAVPAASFSTSRARLNTPKTTPVEEAVLEPFPSSEAESPADRSMASHQTPSSSTPKPDAVPNHQVLPKRTPLPSATASSSTPAASAAARKPSHIPQINSAATHRPGTQKSPYADLRWTPEPVTFSYPSFSNNVEHAVPTHTLHIRSTRNNVLMTLTDGLGPLFGTVSAGSDKTFKNAQRSTYEAAAQASIKMFDRVVEWSREASGGSRSKEPKIRLSYNGLFGSAKEAVTTTLSGPQGAELRKLLVRVEDRTKIKIGGVRARKPRRL